MHTIDVPDRVLVELDVRTPEGQRLLEWWDKAWSERGVWWVIDAGCIGSTRYGTNDPQDAAVIAAFAAHGAAGACKALDLMDERD